MAAIAKEAGISNRTERSTHFSDAPATAPVCRHCQVCQRKARVSVLSRYVDGEPHIENFCLDCADHAGKGTPVDTRNRLSSGLLLMIVGILSIIMAAITDYVPGFKGTHPGIGFLQTVGFAVSVCCIVFGAMLRIDLLAIAGGMLLALTIGADLVILDRTPGFGWKQSVFMVGAGCVVVLGLYLRSTSITMRQITSSHRLTTDFAH